MIAPLLFPVPNSDRSSVTSRVLTQTRPQSKLNGVYGQVAGFLILIAFAAGQLAAAQVPGASQWPKTDFDKRSVDLREIMSGGPPKDGIPAIDAPKFVAAAQADEWIANDEPVIVLAWEGKARAYPLQILMWHEIVNDTLGSVPVSVTFCPLCNSSIAFDRRLDGKVLDFGTTGRLRKSDMVMYDRQTESWWQQLIGEGIVGEMTGKRLKTLPADIVSYAQFKAAFPKGDVLSRDTGHFRNYGQNPYRGYDSITDRPFLFRDEIDTRLPPMERVLNVTVGDKQKIYPFGALKASPVINDDFNGASLVIFSRPGTRSALDTGEIAEGRKVLSVTAYQRTLGDQVLTFTAKGDAFVDAQTGSTWNLFGVATAGKLKGQRLSPADSGSHFAFAWLAFRPGSEIHRTNP